MNPLRVKAAGTLMDFLTGHGFSKTKVRQLLKHGAISVNGKRVAQPDHALSMNDRVLAGIRPKPGSEILAQAGIEIVHEDDGVIVINKPTGLLTIATESEKRETAYYLLNASLKERDPSRPERVFIVHRLDRETSGLIVFAKDEAAKKRLQKDWPDAEKKYYAVVEGVPKPAEGKVESYLGETRALKVYSTAAGEESKHAVTRYRLLKAGAGRALLDVTLDTGKKHQIRVHLSDIGCPVVGDKKYGASTNPIRRIVLHAYSLTFTHPVTGKKMYFSLPLPRAFDELVKERGR